MIITVHKLYKTKNRSIWSLYCFYQLMWKKSIVLMTELQNAIPLIHAIRHLYIYYCINWLRSVLDHTVEGGSPLTPMVPAHLSIPLISGRGTVTETCGIGCVVPPDDLWIGLDTYTNCTLVYDLLSTVCLMRFATCIHLYWLIWKGWPMVACVFRALVVLYRIMPIFT